jgi:hypothetical protein
MFKKGTRPYKFKMMSVFFADPPALQIERALAEGLADPAALWDARNKMDHSISSRTGGAYRKRCVQIRNILTKKLVELDAMAPQAGSRGAFDKWYIAWSKRQVGLD